MRVTPVALSLLLLTACGRFNESQLAGSVHQTPVPTGSSVDDEIPIPWLEAPSGEVLELIPWGGGPPMWNLPYEWTQDVIFEAKNFSSFELRAAFGMPAECLESDAFGEGGWYSTAPWKDCALPVFAERGADEAALRFLEVTGRTIYALAGSGPVKVAWALNWETWGMQDDRDSTYVFTPTGFVAEPSHSSWQQLRDAVLSAYRDALYRELRSVFPPSDWDEEPYVTWPLAFGTEYGDSFGVPEAVDDGWTITVTAIVDRPAECHACQTEFGIQISLEFSTEGVAESARFLGYCWFPDRHASLNENDLRADDVIDATDSLAERLPTCQMDVTPEAPVSTF